MSHHDVHGLRPQFGLLIRGCLGLRELKPELLSSRGLALWKAAGLSPEPVP